MKRHYLELIALFIVELIIMLPFSLSLSISNVEGSADDVSAMINWTTDGLSDSAVRYGKTTNLGSIKSKVAFTRKHLIRLTFLDPASTYYFEVRSTDGSSRAVDNNSGSFYSFTTYEEDNVKPFIDVVLPEDYNSDRIDIGGETEPYTEITLYVNGGGTDLRKITTGSSGIFNFIDVKLAIGLNTLQFRARDRAFNLNQTNYRMTVDVTKPRLTIQDFPDIMGEKNLTIKGSVNEPVTLNVYLTYGSEDTKLPAKVTGLTNTSMGSNLVELIWGKSLETDFDHYTIYREDIGAIATARPAAYNGYTDVRVKSGETYTYRVSVRDTSGNMGPKSDPLTVTVLSGGTTNVAMPQAIDIPITGDRKLERSINVSGAFNFELDLDKGDGSYQLLIEAVDKANNKDSFDKTIILDTTPPKIEIQNPKHGTNIYESYADEVDIEGVTDPNAEVFLYVQRVPLGELNVSFSINALIEDLAKHPDHKLSGDCALKIAGRSRCTLEADYTTTADSNGIFKFHDVDLTSLMGFGTGVTIVPSQNLGGIAGQTDKRAELFFIASDGYQRAGKHISYPIKNCWSGNFSWDVVHLIEYQSPTFLSAERLAEGTETIYFYLNFSYHAFGDPDFATVSTVSISKACDKYIIDDPKYNVSCKIMPNSCTTKSRQEKQGNTLWYFACPLRYVKGMDKWMQADWEDFLSAVSNEMVFPFKIRVNYQYKDEMGVIQNAYQTSCETVTYALDASKIDFKEVLPDWLLYDAVEWLDEATQKLTKLMDQIRQVLEYTAIACLVTFGLKFFVTVYRKFTCHMESFKGTLEAFTSSASGSGGKQTCPPGDKREELSNTQLKEQCSACASAWNAEEKLYQAYRWLCDRVFCHRAPSSKTRDMSDKEIEEKSVAQQAQQCQDAGDSGVRGQPLEPYRCSQGDPGDIDMRIVKDNYAGDECYRLIPKGGKDYGIFVKLKDPVDRDANLYKFRRVSKKTLYGTADDIYAVKEGSRYITEQSQSCSELCAEQGYDKNDCMTVDTCAEKDNPSTDSNKKGTTSETLGYTKGCFNYANRDAIGKDPEKRQECCCWKEVEGKAAPKSRYYDYTDVVDNPLEGQMEKDTKSKEGYPEFSYRYNKIDYKTKKEHDMYNPNRYVEGRDMPACFGAPHAMDIISKEPRMTLDPFKDHLAAFQCLCISGIYNRIQILVNIMTMMRGCLLHVRTTGTADAGVCKELFSQYVCSMMWQIITTIRSGCIPFVGGDIETKGIDGLEAISHGLDSVWESVSESQNELAEEYGNVQLKNLVGQSEEAVARKVCLGAFGYDWEIGVTDVLDAAYSTPYATLVQAVTRSREYLTFDPFYGKSTYEYRASWLINPGCDLYDYNVYLTCVTRDEIDDPNNPGIDCSRVNDPEGSDCDCQYIGTADRPNSYLLYDGKALAQGTMEDKDAHKIVMSQYRYDHLKFVLRPDRGIRGDERAKCFPQYHDDGVFYFPLRDRTARDIEACYVDVSSGIFRCLSGAAFWGLKGSGYFVRNVINGKNADLETDNTVELNAGDSVHIKSTVWRSEGHDQCIYVSVKDQKGDEEAGGGSGVLHPVLFSGEVEYDLGPVVSSLVAKEGGKIFVTENTVDGTGAGRKVARMYWHDWRESTFKPGVEFRVKFNDVANHLGATGPNGQIDISSESKDTIQIQNGGQVEIGGMYDTDKKELVIKYDEVGIVVERVDLLSGKNFAEFTISVRPTGAEYDLKIVTIRLVHLKDSNRSFTSESECNIHDIVKYNNNPQEKTYKIRVEPAGSAPTGPNKAPIVTMLKVEQSSGKNRLRVHIKAKDDRSLLKYTLQVNKKTGALQWSESGDLSGKDADLILDPFTVDTSGEYIIRTTFEDGDGLTVVNQTSVYFDNSNWWDGQRDVRGRAVLTVYN